MLGDHQSELLAKPEKLEEAIEEQLEEQQFVDNVEMATEVI